MKTKVFAAYCSMNPARGDLIIRARNSKLAMKIASAELMAHPSKISLFYKGKEAK